MRFLADENFNNLILDGLRGRPELIDVVRAQEVVPPSTPDPDVLAWAAAQSRIVLTHDIKTFPGFAYARVHRGEPMPGVIAVPAMLGVGRAIADLVLIAACCTPEEFKDQVWFLPI